MGTKANPGKFDPLAKLGEHEPFIVLRGQDRLAPDVVREWARRARDAGTPAEKVNEALAIADEMEAWPNRKVPD